MFETETERVGGGGWEGVGCRGTKRDEQKETRGKERGRDRAEGRALGWNMLVVDDLRHEPKT